MIRSDLEAVLLVLSYEQLRLSPYDDGVGVQTCGWGHKILPGETDLLKPITRERANALFLADFQKHEDGVMRHLVNPLDGTWKPLTPLQIGALTSLCFNIGIEAFRTSSVCRFINDNERDGVPDAFRLWNKGRVKGKLQVMKGLADRREAEVRLWLKGSAG